MTLLEPISAALAAGIGTPILVALYLLKLRRRPVRVSSTVLWTRAVHDLQVNVPFRWLRPTWVFLLQLAALLCLAAALGRPTMEGQGASAARVVIIVDRSASMSALDGAMGGRPSTRLDEARLRALTLVDQLARSGAPPSVAVIEVAASARSLTPLTANLADARQAIAGIQPTDQAGNLAEALLLAGTLLRTEQSAAEDERPQPGVVYVFSDGGSASGRELTVAGGIVRFERVGGDEAATRENLGIVALGARRDFDDPANVRVFARVQNASTGPVAASVALLLDGVEVDRRAIEAPGRSGESDGQSTVTFALATRSAGVATVRIDRPDLLASDNEASLVLAAAVRPRVLLVVPDDQADDPLSTRGPHWMLPAALQEMGLPLRIVPASAYERDVAAGEGLGAELVVFDRVRPRVAPPVATLSFGAGMPVEGLDAGPGRTEGFAEVLSWSRGHPVLRNVALDALVVRRPLRLPEPTGRVAELVRGTTGPLMLIAEERGVRRLVVGFDLAESNWPVQLGFTIFLVSAVDHLTLRGDDQAGVWFSTSRPAEIELPAGEVSDGARLVLDGPIRVDTLAQDVVTRGGRSLVGVGVLERAGVYRLVEPTGERDALRAVAVNLADTGASLLSVAAALEVSGDTVSGEAGGHGLRELWPLFVIAAVALLAVEWVVTGWRMRV